MTIQTYNGTTIPSKTGQSVEVVTDKVTDVSLTAVGDRKLVRFEDGTEVIVLASDLS